MFHVAKGFRDLHLRKFRSGVSDTVFVMVILILAVSYVIALKSGVAT